EHTERTSEEDRNHKNAKGCRIGGRFGLHPKEIDSGRWCASKRRTREVDVGQGFSTVISEPSKSNKEIGWLATSWPPIRGWPTAARAARRGNSSQGRRLRAEAPLARAAVSRGNARPRPVRKGPPLSRVATDGQGSHRLRRGGGGRGGVVYVPVIICNYMKRHNGSVEVTAGPTMPWRVITPYGIATIRRNQ
ncbi:hypothetical protein B296_00037740, partial [Ensete ventricosum]